MKYAYYNNDTGQLIGFYDDEIHESIPEPNIELTDEQWQEAVDNHYNFVDVDSGTISTQDFRTLDQVKTSQKALINSAAHNEIIAGFSSDALGDAYMYQSEETDQLNLIGMVMAGTDDYFKCSADGGQTWGYELHTAAQLKQVLEDGKAIKLGILQKAQSLKGQIDDATTIADVEAIVW